MRNVLLILSVLFITTAQAQSLKQFPSVLEHHLESIGAEEFTLFVKANSQALNQYAESGDLRLYGSVQGYQLIRTERTILRSLLNAGYLTYVEAPIGDLIPLNDRMLLNNNVLPLHQGLAPLMAGLEGSGVVMGIVDTGIELAHPDFLDEQGETRVLELWDHTMEFDEEHVPEPYGFGTLWTKQEIDDGVSVAEEQVSWFGHGSTVTGTACGDGSAVDDFTGVAPKSEMVIVSFDFDRPGFLGDVANSVQYLFNKAEDLEMPCVVNTSLGTYYGSHDGLDPTSLYIDSLIDASPGRMVVAAVGNSHGVPPYHLRMEPEGTDTLFSWFEAENTLSNESSGVLYELWADTAAFSDIRFASGADHPNPSIGLRSTGTFLSMEDVLGVQVDDELVNSQGDILGTVQYWAQLRGEQIQMQVFIEEPDSSNYRFRLMLAGEGRIDIWTTNIFGTSDIVQESALPSLDEFPEIVNYVLPDKRMHMVSSWTCSDKVITVANYVNRTSYLDVNGETTTINETEGELASSSSSGPTRDERQKPDLAATGTVTLSTGNFQMLESLIDNEPFKVAQGGMHFRNAGSSMASPVVAGTAALLLEQCPFATQSTIESAILDNTATDSFTGLDLPGERWGYGKVDAFGAVTSLTVIPEVIQEDDVLTTSGGVSYQWFLDGEPIEDEVGESLSIAGAGVYTVQIVDDLGCIGLSDPVLVTSLGEPVLTDWIISPNPGNGLIQLSGTIRGDVIMVYDASGKFILNDPAPVDGLIDLQSSPEGIYLIECLRDGLRSSKRYILNR